MQKNQLSLAKIFVGVMNSALTNASNLHWAQKTAIYVFSLGVFFSGLDRAIPAFHNFFIGFIACN